ncbi:MAG: hypothetical protein Q4E16_00470 [Neisseria sp.]|nr:hypothetical protein [Neisseria sp.]
MKNKKMAAWPFLRDMKNCADYNRFAAKRKVLYFRWFLQISAWDCGRFGGKRLNVGFDAKNKQTITVKRLEMPSAVCCGVGWCGKFATDLFSMLMIEFLVNIEII